MTATVWLAKDLNASSSSSRQYVTIKISVSALGKEFLTSRRQIAEKLFSTDPNHPGYSHVRFMLDTFKLRSRGGEHFCVVYDVLREPISDCVNKEAGSVFGFQKLRILMGALLKGLDYMHSACGVVHTDLKGDNIMLGLGDKSILEEFVRRQLKHPPGHKAPDSHGRIIYQSCGDLGGVITNDVIATAKITDIGLAEWGDQKNNKPIQSNAFTCPEVILVAGWSYPADIWNMGVVMWDMVETWGLFDRIDTRPGYYHSDQHLGQMIALLGPPPKKFLERGSASATYFDENGNFRKPELIPKDYTFEHSITSMKGEEKALFIDFAKKMIQWDPEDRWTAKQLLDHPFLTKETVSCLETDAEKKATLDLVERFAVNKTRSNTSTPQPPASPVDTPDRTPEPSIRGFNLSNRASTVSSPELLRDVTSAPASKVNSTSSSHRNSNVQSQNIIDGILGPKKAKTTAGDFHTGSPR